MTTKEKILFAALDLFSSRGYEASSVDEIAEAAGVKGPALYYHFKGKDGMLDALVDMLEAHYTKNVAQAQAFPKSCQELIAASVGRINFTMHDPSICKVRRFITMEQFRNAKISALATKHFTTGLEDMYTVIFEHMIQDGLLKKEDPRLLAEEFTAPVTLMIHLVDRAPEQEDYAMMRIRRHMEHFVKVYGMP